ncbi:hypothetical protein TCAL_06480 [Tigriopus californicus]|uniref:RNA-directed DNA polymerase n=1 Tax=Tigriopus californicus TaxID=6832 RepID=A0A553PM93_TIGCA|nr:hypothetical protein TCAL_06480 [Tigriopus californicus]
MLLVWNHCKCRKVRLGLINGSICWVLSSSCISVSEPLKISSNPRFPCPIKNNRVAELHGFNKPLGKLSANHCQKLISNAGWTQDHTIAVENVKTSLISPPVLAHFDSSLETLLSTDAIVGKLVFVGNRAVVLSSEIKTVLPNLHLGHQGITATKRLTRLSVFWPGIHASIEDMINKCPDCQETRPAQRKEAQRRMISPTTQCTNSTSISFRSADTSFWLQ